MLLLCLCLLAACLFTIFLIYWRYKYWKKAAWRLLNNYYQVELDKASQADAVSDTIYLQQGVFVAVPAHELAAQLDTESHLFLQN